MTTGEYLSRPQARVVRAAEKLVIPDVMVSAMSEGSVSAVYTVAGKPGGGKGTAHDTVGQNGRE